MSSYITITKIAGTFSTLAADRSDFGTTGPLSMKSITQAPAEGDERFAVRAATFSNGGFASNFEVPDQSENPQHREEFIGLLGAAAKAKPKASRT